MRVLDPERPAYANRAQRRAQHAQSIHAPCEAQAIVERALRKPALLDRSVHRKSSRLATNAIVCHAPPK
jgi:hypothetical protein